MLLFTLSLLIGFIVNAFVGASVAQLIASPLTREGMSEFEREKKEIKMVPMLGGYFLLTLIMVLAYPYFGLEGSWFLKGTVFGLFAGGISFVAVYSIISGWSILPPRDMLISGLIDVIPTALAGIAIAFIYSF